MTCIHAHIMPESIARRPKTRERLINATVALLAQHNLVDITTQDVLALSGVARGTLYRHFPDFSALLESAMVEAFSRDVQGTIAYMDGMIKTSHSAQDLFDGLRKVTLSTQAPQIANLRYGRIRLMAYSLNNPRLSQALSEIQETLTQELTRQVKIVQAKGWFDERLDARSVAVFVQAYTIGKVVDDVSQQHMSPQGWNDLIDQVIALGVMRQPKVLEQKLSRA